MFHVVRNRTGTFASEKEIDFLSGDQRQSPTDNRADSDRLHSSPEKETVVFGPGRSAIE